MRQMETPRFYGLEHESWRPHQHDVVKQMLGIGEGSVLLLEAPTGSGKTAVARAVGSRHSVTALCRTKMLQASNYADNYGFDVLYGKGNYACALDPNLTGAECEYADRGMHKCPEAHTCEYLQQKALVASSSLRSLNYAYWLMARWPRQNPTDYVFCDEGHLLSDTVLDYAGCTITASHRKRWGLPPFPELTTAPHAVLLRGNAVENALGWLREAKMVLLNRYFALEKQKAQGPHILKQLRQCEYLGNKLRASINALKSSGKDWYIKSGKKARQFRGAWQPAFVCKPLTARHHAPRFFLNGWRTVVMSATVGDPATFAGELGLTDYNARSVPSNWPADSRPIFIPKDAPRLGQAAKRKGNAPYDLQADLIARLIQSVPSRWGGVIHHTSIAESRKLADRLARRGLQDRLWMPPQGQGTEQQLASWQAHKKHVPNALAVTYSWHEGVDLLDERICIVAKTPFPALNDLYERARLDYDGKFFLQRTAWDLEQACGRTRRGREEDYDTNGEQNGLVSVVDGNWTRCQKYLSPAFREAIVEI